LGAGNIHNDDSCIILKNIILFYYDHVQLKRISSNY
jgi:hypothetical protein